MNALQLIRHGQQYLAERKLDKATEIYRALMDKTPDLPPVQYFASELAVARGDFASALHHIDRALDGDRNAPALHLMKAQILLALGQGLKAQESATLAANLRPDDVATQVQVAQIFSKVRNSQGAAEYYIKAKSLGAKSPQFLYEFAINRHACNKADEALEAIETFLGLMPTHGGALLLRAHLKEQSEQFNHVDELKTLLNTNGLSWKDEAGAAYALAKELEDLGLYDQAFASIRQGAALQRTHIGYDSDDEVIKLRAIADTFSPDVYHAIRAADTKDSPVFIVGMPEAGTDVLGALLSRHETVTTTGEQDYFGAAMRTLINEHITAQPDRKLSPLQAALEVDYGRMGEMYLDRVHAMIGNSQRIIDALPYNFLYCGIIQKALPNARIVHVTRNPLDTCYAAFKTLYNLAYFFSYDLNDLADYYIAYRELMKHWHAIMPGQICDVSYESLIADPTREGKRIAEYAGLPWADKMAEVASTAPASSVGNWQNYAQHLKLLEDRLRAASFIDD